MPELVFVDDIENLTVKNEYYRNVLFTTKDTKMQLVLMHLSVGEEIGKEVHDNVDQFFRIEQGQGKVIFGENNKEREIKNNDAIIIPAGTLHNIINTGNTPLKLYSIYTPANHKDGLMQKHKPQEHTDE